MSDDRRWSRIETIIAVAILTAFVLLALAPGVFSSPEAVRSGGEALARPSIAHPLGTDALGRDTWARLVAVLGPGLAPVVLVIGLTGWLGIARVVRAELLRARAVPHVIAARALGVGVARLAV